MLTNLRSHFCTDVLVQSAFSLSLSMSSSVDRESHFIITLFDESSSYWTLIDSYDISSTDTSCSASLNQWYRMSMVSYSHLYPGEIVICHVCRSPIQCGCAFYQPNVHTRIVGGIESIPHSWWIAFHTCLYAKPCVQLPFSTISLECCYITGNS